MHSVHVHTGHPPTHPPTHTHTHKDSTAFVHQPCQLQGELLSCTHNKPVSDFAHISQCLGAIVRRLKAHELNQPDNEKVKCYYTISSLCITSLALR